MAIELIDIIKQKNGGTFALLDSNDLLGGIYQVDSLDERNNIPSERRKEGMLCYVKNDTMYQLIGGIDNVNWTVFATTTQDIEVNWEDIINKPTIPTKTSELENDKGYITSADLDDSQNHVHSNMDILSSITQERVSEWDGKADEIHQHDPEYVTYTNASDSNIKTVKDALDKLLYFDLSISLSSTSALNVEKGKTLSNTVFNWTYNKSITSQSFNGQTLDVNARTYTYPDSFNSNKTFTLRASDGTKDFSRNISFNFMNGRYWGVSSLMDLNSSFITSLSNKELSTNRNKTFTVNCGEDEFIFYCIPSSFGVPTFTVGGFSGGFDKISTIEFTNSSGHTENYDIWKSSNNNLGTTTVVVS